MGCDIHVLLERKRHINGEEKWVNIDYWKKNHYDGGFSRLDFYDGRCYDLFALLADVRNRGTVEPIAERRGIPSDASVTTLEEYSYWDLDAHSASHYTLKELMDYHKKNPTQTYTGLLNLDQRLELANGKLPDGWCQGTNMENYERAYWEDESPLKYFLEQMIERAKEELNIYYDSKNERVYDQSDNIRVVFWFDN